MPVGRLVTANGEIYFEYWQSFLEARLQISPFKCPLRAGLQKFNRYLFGGLPGVFDDSLPDSWGRLLMDRKLRKSGILPESVSPLDRLSYVGNSGMGALAYEPGESTKPEDQASKLDLDLLGERAKKTLEGATEDALEELVALNGSSGGARPKIMIGLDSERKKIISGTQEIGDEYGHWMVKFPGSADQKDAGAMEYAYSLMAGQAGVDMEQAALLPSKTGPGYFAAKRFDRDGKNRRHAHSVCGLLHSDFRHPALDYQDLLKLAEVLTRDRRETMKMYRLAVFNVLAHNRDDHSKNFSFIMDWNGGWKLSPAYDLTFSHGPNGQQSSMVMGEGESPAAEHLEKLGEGAGIRRAEIRSVMDQTKDALASWPKLAGEYGVSKENTNKISGRILKAPT